MTDLKTLLNENNQNIKNYIDKETNRAQSAESEIKEKYLPKASNSDREAYIEYTNNGLDLNIFGKGSINLATGGLINLNTNQGIIVTSDITNGGLTLDFSGGRVGNAADPIENTDLTTKQYVDKIENKIPITTSALTNDSDFQTSTQVAEAIANADISADLTDYVTNSELASILTGYAKIDEATGGIIINSDWNDIENKPEYFNTDWNFIDNKPEYFNTDWVLINNKPNILTVDKYNEDIEEINNKIIANTDNISSLSNGIVAIQTKTEDIESSMGEKVSINHQGNISINGTITLPSNYSLIDESGNDRLGINTSIDNDGLIFKSENNLDNLNNSFSLTKNEQNSAMLDLYFNGVNGILNCASGLSLSGTNGISFSSSGEISIQAGYTSLIMNNSKIELQGNSTLIELNSVSGIKIYNQLEIEKVRPDSSIGHSSIILYDDNDNKYEIYVDTLGKLTCSKITAT